MSLCAGKRISVTNSLVSLYPEIADEFHSTKNGSLKVEEVFANSGIKIWWQCPNNPQHSWLTAPHSREQITKNGRFFAGCPECYILPRSKIEILIGFELLHFFQFDIDKHKLRFGDSLFDVDLIIDDLNLCIEYDGAFWHSKKFEKDKAKNVELSKYGWKTIRIREKPLELTSDNDLESEVLYEKGYKNTVNNLLIKIEKVCNLKIEGIDSYLKFKNPINKNAADKYIDKLLKDKEQTTLTV